MPWLQINITTVPSRAESFEDILLAAGCAAVTYKDNQDQPIFEPELGTTPLWDSTVITGLFAAEQDLDKTLEFIKQAQGQLFPDVPLAPIQTEILEDKDWERTWMDGYKPMRFGERLWVCPSWMEPPEPTAANLMLDPGLAFGTGTHPTTALCLEWLDSQDLKDKNVTDFGCGSGILGIAALLLGAKHVLAIDIDPQALQATLDNLERNKLAMSTLDAFLPEKAPSAQTEVLVANILAGPLIELAPQISERVSVGGKLCLSGLLEHQGNEILETYSQWFQLDEPKINDGWIRVTGTKR